MTDADIERARRCFEIETPDMVNDITGGKVKFIPTVVVSEKPLRLFSPTRADSAEFYAPEILNEYYTIAKPGDYDTVGCYFLHYDTASGYRIPRTGYGVGYYDASHALGMFAVSCAPKIDPRDEIFLHEWMHGLDGFYGNKKGVKLPAGALHGLGQHGFVLPKAWRPGDNFRGWMEWYRDYLNCQVKEGDQLVGLGSVAWNQGPMRKEAQRLPQNDKDVPLPLGTYPAWVYQLMKGDLSHAILGPPLLETRLEQGDLSKTGWRMDIWNKSAGTEARIQPGDNGTFLLENPSPNNAAIVRPMSFEPATNYVFTAEVQTAGVEITQKGGQFAVSLSAGDSISTKDMSGTKPWTPIVLPFTTGSKPESRTLKMSIGGFASLAKGRAYFRNVQVKKIGYPLASREPK